MKLRQGLVIQISTACLMLASFAELSAGSSDDFRPNISQSSKFRSESLFIESFVATTPIKSSGNDPEPQPVNIRNGSFRSV